MHNLFKLKNVLNINCGVCLYNNVITGKECFCFCPQFALSDLLLVCISSHDRVGQKLPNKPEQRDESMRKKKQNMRTNHFQNTSNKECKTSSYFLDSST